MRAHSSLHHLIQRAEQYGQQRKQNPDRRPDWLVGYIDTVAELFEPLVGVGRVGFETQLTEAGWSIQMYLGAKESYGGKYDGKTDYVDFHFDVLGLMESSGMVHALNWTAMPMLGHQAQGGEFQSLLTLEAELDAQPFQLTIYAIPPEMAGPGMREYTDGSCLPV